MWKTADDRYDALCMDTVRVIAEGGDLGEVLFTVGRSMDDCDRVDAESVALFERAKARLISPVIEQQEPSAKGLVLVDKGTGEPCPIRGNLLCDIPDPNHRHMSQALWVQQEQGEEK